MYKFAQVARTQRVLSRPVLARVWPATAALGRVPPLSALGSAVRTNATKADADATERVVSPETTPKAPQSETSEGAEPAEGVPAEDPVVAELRAKLAEKDKALAEMKNHYARAIADFRNLQDTTKKEMQKARDFALQKFAKDLLESVDNFTLALGSVKADELEGEVKNLFDGVSMTQAVFEKTLEKHGIVKIDPMGEQFDPNQHEATFQVPQPDKEPGTVFHVLLPGYTLNSRVLRPAKVGLVKGEN